MDDEIAYVDAGGADNALCSTAVPCAHVMAALTTGHRYVKVRGTIDGVVTIDHGRVVTLIGEPGAGLTCTDCRGGPLLTVQDSGTSVVVARLTLGGTTDRRTIAVSVQRGAPTLLLQQVDISYNAGIGVRADSGRLELTNSTVRHNERGGIVIGGTTAFTAINNTIFANGTGASGQGGIAIITSQAAGSRLEFNSIYGNAAQDGIGAGVYCVADAFTARNNIIANNENPGNAQLQVSGTCLHTYTDVWPGLSPAGMGNFSADPRFRNAASGDLHLAPGSPAIRAADPGSDLSGSAARDRDGVLRSSSASIGAYEP